MPDSDKSTPCTSHPPFAHAAVSEQLPQPMSSTRAQHRQPTFNRRTQVSVTLIRRGVLVRILSIHRYSTRGKEGRASLTGSPPARQPPAIVRRPHTAWRPPESGTRILAGSGKPNPESH